MTKVNPLTKTKAPVMSKTEKLAGGTGMSAANQSNINLLRRVVLANLLWENNAYVDGNSTAEQIVKLIPLCRPIDVAKIAVEARTMQKLRHTPLFIVSEMCKYEGHNKLVGEILPKIITRADMITDFLAIYWKADKKRKISAQAKKGLAKSFGNFNEYQFAKYDRNADIKLRDVMFLVHPTPEQGKEELYKAIANRTLATPDTWEVALSTGKDKKETWTRLISENKIGGLAMLRNLNNMVEANVSKDVIASGLANLKSSMLLPLDFLKASKMVNVFSREIEDAMIISYANLPKLPGRTLFIVDISGSMGSPISGKSGFARLEVACAMAMLAVNQCESYELVATAGNDSTRRGAHEHIKYPKKGFDVFTQITDTRRKIGGGGIFTRQCIEWCGANIEGTFDRIIVFSDSQDCDGTNYIPKPYGKYNYICDVSSEKRGINYKGVWTAEISGWSENFLTFIAASEGLENKFQEEQ